MRPSIELYSELFAEVRERVRAAQRRAATSVNGELIRLYWEIGRAIDLRQHRDGWGSGVIPRLATDLRSEMPDQKGFSARNIGRMVAFYRAYPILPQPAAKLPEPGAPVAARAFLTEAEARTLLGIPWFHHVALLERVKERETRLWYVRKTIERGWSRETLLAHVRARAHEREGRAVTNFAQTLPEARRDLAQGLLKDPYVFDFLTLDDSFHERELEAGLLAHLQKFLLELGRGFAFVGRQYSVEVGGDEFHIDLLFYQLQLRCFVVIELKRGAFQPEHVGKLNFYCSVVDDTLRHSTDAPTVGLLLCQTKDRIVAEYALRDVKKPIGVADYELSRALPERLASSLPTIEELEEELSREWTARFPGGLDEGLDAAAS